MDRSRRREPAFALLVPASRLAVPDVSNTIGRDVVGTRDVCAVAVHAKTADVTIAAATTRRHNIALHSPTSYHA
jgi:hypothetical protein